MSMPVHRDSKIMRHFIFYFSSLYVKDKPICTKIGKHVAKHLKEYVQNNHFIRIYVFVKYGVTLSGQSAKYV